MLLAASGPFIHSFNAQDGSFLSTWPSQGLQGKIATLTDTAINTKGSGIAGVPQSERPSKRRKTSLSPKGSSSTSAEILVEDQTETECIGTIQASHADVSKMICTSNGSHVIVVTGEDKAIRVFELSEDGSLIQISERHALYIATIFSAH